MKPAELFRHYRELIPDFQGFLDALAFDLPASLRVNTLLTRPTDLVQRLARKGMGLEPTALGESFWLAPGLANPGHLPEHLMGLVYAQGLGSAIPPLALNPTPRDSVLDLCAAPGSKATQMAQMMRNHGLLIANEPDRRRHASLLSNLRRMGVTNTVVTAYQGQNFPMRGRFSRVLADVPCSGEGKARLNPTGDLISFRPGPGDLPRVQRALLLRAFDLLAEDGCLVYATCTYNPMENEAVVDHLLRSRPSKLVPIALKIPHEPGITAWEGERFSHELAHAWRIYPHRLPSVGFFVAQIRRG